ncbi:MAG: hypothetical protein Q4G35_06620 [Propionibacteriaceae bacterium]|nr:hypothetical protein [Propionibacteriaceae bacterium]
MAEARRAAPEPTRLEKVQKAYSVVGDILTPGRIALFLAAIALLIVGVVGGWDAATATDVKVPEIAAKESHDAAPFTVSVSRIRYGDELPGVALESEEYRYLFLVMDVTNTSDSPVPAVLIQRAITLDVPGLPTTPGGSVLWPDVYRGADGLRPHYYQPGVHTPTVVVWQQLRTQEVPAEVELTLNAYTWRYSIVEEREAWFDEAPSATMTLPLEPLS